jgi:trehalose 6-phosphate phosphatase
MVALTGKVKHPSLSWTDTRDVTQETIEASQETGRRAAVLASPQVWALFIDIDGTLLGMAPSPDAVSVPCGLVKLLGRLMAGLDGAVALLTGRRIADADRLFAPLQLVASGVHGAELRAERAGPISVLAPPMPTGVVQAANDIAGLAQGIMVEQKGPGLAVHYRNAPLAREALEAKVAAIVAASPHDLVLRRGRMVLEILPRGFSKATALTELASRPPFRGRRPVMVGDDAGDESALVAAERLGGLALRVAGEHFGPAAADFDGVESVHAWLEAFASRLAKHGQPGKLEAEP